MKNLFEEPYIEVVRFPADAFTNGSANATTGNDIIGEGEDLT